MTTGKYELVIKWASGQGTLCGEMTDHQHGEICRILSPDYRAQLPSQGGEAVAWYSEDHLTDKSATTYDSETAERWRAKGWPVTTLYTHPPSPDAELVELLREAVRVLDWWKSTDDLDALQERIDAKLASLEVKP